MSSEVAEKMSFTPAQCRAARALLNWSQAELAEASKVATKTIADFERESRTPYDRTLADVRRALEAAGIEFTIGGQPGVKVKVEDQVSDEVLLSEVDKDQFWIIRGGKKPVLAHANSLRKALETASKLIDQEHVVSSIRDLLDRTIWPAQMRRLSSRIREEPPRLTSIAAENLNASNDE